VLLVIVGVVVVWVVASSWGSKDNWKPCDEAMQARLFGNLDYDVSTISWEDQGGGTEVARGTVHSGVDTYSFECGVTDGELEWLDLS
jgi:hypothetical protein